MQFEWANIYKNRFKPHMLEILLHLMKTDIIVDKIYQEGCILANNKILNFAFNIVISLKIY